MMGQAGVQAGVPVEVRQETPSNLAFQVCPSFNVQSPWVLLISLKLGSGRKELKQGQAWLA